MQARVVAHVQGSLGKQMFQYAAALSLAKRENAKLLLNVQSYERDRKHCFELGSYRIEAEVCKQRFCFAKKHQEDRMFYFETLPTNIKKRDLVELKGYFQHWRYSKDVLPLLREQLILRKGLSGTRQDLLAKIQSSNTVGVHIRRGDYCQLTSMHFLASLSYYTRAFDWMRARVENPHFFVFSDDPAWVEKNFAASPDWTLVRGDLDSPAEDLELLRNCRHFILSASSFSWWAARLGEKEDSLVLMPRIWMLQHGVKSSELCPSHWHLLPDQARFQPELLEPKISVIIPVYNVQEYLSDCIESVLEQSFGDFEILLVDDASTDGSLQIAEQYQSEEARIRILRHSEKRGPGAARNTGIEAARGEYLQFVDSDDWIHPLMLEKLYRELSGEQEKSIALCGIVITSRFQYFHRRCGTRNFTNSKDKNNIYNIPNIVNATWNKLYTKDLFLPSGIRFPESCYYEDLAVLPLLLHDTVCIQIVNEPLYYYNQRLASIMRSPVEKKHFFSYIEVVNHIVEGLRARAWNDYRPVLECIMGGVTNELQSFLFSKKGLAYREKLKCIRDVYKGLLEIPEIASYPSKTVQSQLHRRTKTCFLVYLYAASVFRLIYNPIRRISTIFAIPFVYLLKSLGLYALLKKNHILRKLKRIVLGDT